jgi:iron complex outermembrane receptor protein
MVSFVRLALPILAVPCLLTAQGERALPDVMDLGLEDLMKIEIDSVFGASGYKQYVSDAPASITIITGGEIRRYGYRTLADVLRNVPGFYVTSDRVSSYIGVRGFGRPGDYNSRVLLMVDGHRMHDPVSGASAYGMDFPVDVDLIDRVEVIRGPNSSVYIASALLGVINVVTKQAHDEKGLSISGQAGSFGAYGSRLTYGHRFKDGLDLLVSGTYFDSRGPGRLYFKEFDSAATNYGIARNADGSRSFQQFAKLSYRGFTLEGAYSSPQQADPTASYGTIFNDPGERIRLKTGYLDLGYEHNFGGDWGYECRLYYDNFQYHGTYPIDESPWGGPSRVVNEDLSAAQDVGASFALSKKLAGGQTLTFGSEYRYNFQQDQWNYDQPDVTLFQSRQRSSLWGGHVQDEIPLSQELVLDLGLSYDRYSTFGGTINPRAGLIYQPHEGTSLKLLYGQSFRAPTAFELYYAVPGQQANPYLKPETARTTELVLEQALRSGFHLVASGYYYPVRGLIGAGTDPVSGEIVYQNSERVDLKGVEMALKRQSRSGWEEGLSFSLQGARDLDNPGPLTNSPRVLGQANLSVPLFGGKVFASTDIQYVSRRMTQAGDYAGAYVVPNFTLFSKKALHRWEVTVGLYNGFNQVYGDPASVAHQQHVLYQDGRNFRVKFTYHL